MLFSLLKHYLDTDTALKVSQSVYCFTTSIPHGVENYFPRLWGMGISDAIFHQYSCGSLSALFSDKQCMPYYHFSIYDFLCQLTVSEQLLQMYKSQRRAVFLKKIPCVLIV